MTRQAVRELKKALSAGLRSDAHAELRTLAKDSALRLLARSVGFGHGRLAVVRLAMAAQAGADIPAEHWDYCRAAAEAAKDPTLHALFARALREASASRPH